MRPTDARQDTKSTAERSIFDRVRLDLDNSWVGLHSLGLVSHPRKPWAEIDFVLVGPPGVYCLEVKGQLVSRRDGKWVFTNRYGETSTKDEGPFGQVAGATAALARYLGDRLPTVRASAVGYGVLTPDMRWDLSGPDIEPILVYDSRDDDRPFSEYMTRLVAYWTRRLAEMRRREPIRLASADVDDVVDLLRPDFDGRRSLRAQMGAINSELLRLTREQYRVLDGLADNERAFVRGGAGTGKTLLAIEETKRQAEVGKRTLLTCFNRNLAEFLAAALAAEPLVTVLNLHGLMASVVARAGLDNELPAAAPADLYSVFYPRLCLEALASDPEFRAFDALVVDETQDLLREAYLDVLNGLVEGGLAHGQWRLFFDPRQNLFDGTEPGALHRLADCTPAQFRLTVNCRNTFAIATATSLLTDLPSDETLTVEGPEVGTLWHTTEAEQRTNLRAELQRLLGGGVRRSEIVILSDRSFETGAIGPEISAEFSISERTGPGAGVRFSTIQAFKGLEADAILLLDVVDLVAPGARRNLYVASSRARVFLSVFLDRRTEADYGRLATRLGERLAQLEAPSP